jgi:hypothetical protein
MMVVQSMADMCVCSNNMHPPLGSARGTNLGFARGATLGFAQTVRRAKPRRESYVYMYPSASLGVLTWAPLGVQTSASLGVQTSAPLGVHSASLGVLTWAPLGVQTSAPLGGHSQQPHRGDIIIAPSGRHHNNTYVGEFTPRPSATPLYRGE